MSSKKNAAADSGKQPLPSPPKPEDTYDTRVASTIEGLKKVYDSHIRPTEEKYEYDAFRPSWFSDSIVQKKPFILFIGPFSAGKSTFINYLIQNNLLVTGPHPTTDKFNIIMHGDEVENINGRVLISDPSHPFRGLQQFGESFCDSVSCVCTPHPLLQSVTLIDSPGVLEAAGDSKRRRYDYISVMRWFVERSDLVFVMFDPTKLDTGPELRNLFENALRTNESKLRIVLNKGDQVNAQDLMRVYGSLFWALSTLITSTEPPRVYVSSFWDKPYKPDTAHDLFTSEKEDLIYELTDLVPRQSLDKRVATMMKRASDVYLHALLCTTLADRLPKFFGVKNAVKEEMKSLEDTYKIVSEKMKVPISDFGTRAEYENFFNKVKMNELPDSDKAKKHKYLENVQTAINQLLPQLLKPIQNSQIVDPRDRKHVLMLQRQYQMSIERQLDGEEGIQGRLGEQAPAGMNPALQQMQQMMFMQQQMQQMQQLQQSQQAPPPPQPQQLSLEASQQQMMQMMQQMMQKSQSQ